MNSDANGRGGLDDNNRYDDHARGPRSGFALSVIGFFALLGIVGFTSLGVWQIERRAWKLDLIDRVEQRVHAAPVAAPGPAEWPTINAKDDEYRRVTVSGHFLNDRETLVTAVTDNGAGFWVLTPLVTKDRSTILINRGFVPPDRRDPTSRAAGEITGETTVTGLLRTTEPKGAFLRAQRRLGGPMVLARRGRDRRQAWPRESRALLHRCRCNAKPRWLPHRRADGHRLS